MSAVQRTRILAAILGLSLCGLGLTVQRSITAQVTDTNSIVVDDGDPGFSSVGFISTTLVGNIRRYPSGYDADTMYAYGSQSTDLSVEAKWNVRNLEMGTYDVYTTWGNPTPNFARNAPFRLTPSDGNSNILVDQSKAPLSLSWGGRMWHSLGTVTFGGDGWHGSPLQDNQILVSVRPSADGYYTLADAILVRKRAVPKTPPVQTSTSSAAASTPSSTSSRPTPPPAAACVTTQPSGGNWQNQTNPYDVTNDGVVSQVDFDRFTYYINQYGTRPLSTTTKNVLIFLDVSGDNIMAPNDGLLVANYLHCLATQPTPVIPQCVTVTIAAERGWQNQKNPYDVNDDKRVTTTDADMIIASINANTARTLTGTAPAASYFDVNGDGSIAPDDVLSVMNYITCAAENPVGSSSRSSASTSSVTTTKECANSIDDDKDTLFDTNDPGCHTDFNRFNTASYDVNLKETYAANTCGDGIDNNRNNKADIQDYYCHTDFVVTNTASFDPNRGEQYGNPITPACYDGIDSDGDKLEDMADPGCSNQNLQLKTGPEDGPVGLTLTMQSTPTVRTTTRVTSTITVTNAGPDTVTKGFSVRFDPPVDGRDLPAPLRFAPETSAAGCTLSLGAVLCTFNDLLTPRATKTFTVDFVPQSDTTICTSIYTSQIMKTFTIRASVMPKNPQTNPQRNSPVTSGVAQAQTNGVFNCNTIPEPPSCFTNWTDADNDGFVEYRCSDTPGSPVALETAARTDAKAETVNANGAPTIIKQDPASPAKSYVLASPKRYPSYNNARMHFIKMRFDTALPPGTYDIYTTWPVRVKKEAVTGILSSDLVPSAVMGLEIDTGDADRTRLSPFSTQTVSYLTPPRNDGTYLSAPFQKLWSNVSLVHSETMHITVRANAETSDTLHGQGNNLPLDTFIAVRTGDAPTPVATPLCNYVPSNVGTTFFVMKDDSDTTAFTPGSFKYRGVDGNGGSHSYLVHNPHGATVPTPARWELGAMPAGQYSFSAYWPYDPGIAGNGRYSITAWNGSTVVAQHSYPVQQDIGQPFPGSANCSDGSTLAGLRKQPFTLPSSATRVSIELAPSYNLDCVTSVCIAANQQITGKEFTADTVLLEKVPGDIPSTNVTLSSVNVSGCNVVVNYTNSLQRCVHLIDATQKQIVHTTNLFCNPQGPNTEPLTGYNSLFAVGKQVKLCDGNNYQDCSAPVTVTGGGTCGTSSSSVSSTPSTTQSSSSAPSGGSTLSFVNARSCDVTFTYTKNFSTCAHLLDTNTMQILHTQNVFCSATGPVTVPISQFNSHFGIGKQVKLCNGNNYQECTNVTTVANGGACPSSQAMSSVSALSSPHSSSSSSRAQEYVCNGSIQGTPCSSSSSAFSSAQPSSVAVSSIATCTVQNTLPTTSTRDDTGTGFTKTGTWSVWTDSGPQGGSYLWGSPTARAAWNMGALREGLYTLDATWYGYPSASIKATYVVSVDGKEVARLVANQRQSSQSTFAWQRLGNVPLTCGSVVTVQLHSDDALGYLFADAVKLTKAGQ